MPNKKTQAERLHDVVRKIDPELAAAYAETGQWAGGRAPYEILELPNGKRMVRVRSADGDLIGGTGVSVADALSVIETKTGLAGEKE